MNNLSPYSQVQQDLFVFKLLGKTGFFVDIGAGWNDEGGLNSNTLLLEKNGWKGLCFEGDPAAAQKRENYCINSQVINVYINENNLKDFLKSRNCPKIIDYVTIDIEPYSLVGLKGFPFDEFEFKILTFEHDRYYLGPDQKNASTKILQDLGYYRICEDVLAPEVFGNNSYFEDWWVNPKYFSEEFLRKNTFIKQTGAYIVTSLIV